MGDIMKLSVNRAHIIDGLQKAGSITPAKAGAAYLRSIWLKGEHGQLSIMTTDASLEFTGTYPANVTNPGLAGVPGRTFVDLIRQFPSGEMEMSVDNDKFILKQGTRGRYKLPVQNPEWFQDFSPYPDSEPISWTGDVLMELIDRISFCIDDDETREAMSCFCFNPRDNGRIDVCGMNGHQFAMVNIIHDEFCDILPKQGLLINKKYMNDIKKWLSPDEIELNLSEKRLFLKGNKGTEILSVERANNFEYPDYNIFLSKLDNGGQNKLDVKRQDMIDALKRVVFFSPDTGQPFVTMNINANEMSISASGTEGSADETISVNYSGSIDKIAFPTRDLIEIFGHFNSEIVTMTFTGQEDPCGITGAEDNNYTVILMPMRIEDSSYYIEEAD